MTQEELREKIAEWLQYVKLSGENLEWHADQILTIIKEDGYIQLADDKEMPYFTHHTTEEIERLTKGEVYGLAQVDVLKAGWRKVKREGIDGH